MPTTISLANTSNVWDHGSEQDLDQADPGTGPLAIDGQAGWRLCSRQAAASMVLLGLVFSVGCQRGPASPADAGSTKPAVSKSEPASPSSVPQFTNPWLQARRDATCSLIKTLDSLLRQRIETSSYLRSKKSFGQALPSSYRYSLASVPDTYAEAGDRTAKRALHIGQLMVERAEFPQRFEDFFPRHQGGLHDANDPTISSKVRQRILESFLRQTRNAQGEIQLSNDQAYDRNTKDYTLDIQKHNPNTESAECLYLALTAKLDDDLGFGADVGEIPKQYIRDTDGDGLLEFVDDFGTPLRYYRWPTDYLAYLIDVKAQIPEAIAVNDQASQPSKYNWWINPHDPYYLLTFQKDGQPTWYEHGRERFEQAGFFRLHKLYGNRTQGEGLEKNNVGNKASAIVKNVDLGKDEANPKSAWAYFIMPVIVSAGPDAVSYAADEKWKAFGLAWPKNNQRPQVQNLDVLMGRVGGWTKTKTSGWVPDQNMASAASDNIVSVVLRAGGE